MYSGIFSSQQEQADLSGGQKLDFRQLLKSEQALQQYQELRWIGTFDSYLQLVIENPVITANAHQRIHSMILSHGTSQYSEGGVDLIRYKFFDDKLGDGQNAVFGVDESLMSLVQTLESAAKGYGAEKRLILMNGPVGSSKSTIATLFKRGLEAFSRTREGAYYTFGISKEPIVKPSSEETSVALQNIEAKKVVWAKLNTDPLAIIPTELRGQFLERLNSGISDGAPKVQINTSPDPLMRHYLDKLLKRYGGDFSRVLDHVVVKRVLLSEEARCGITTFQPKDPKSQDSTELTGEINFRKLARIGDDSDPRAFSFNGEFCHANRGIIEFIEVLKLDTEFLYDLLGVTAERTIKPKKFPQTRIDLLALGHTNEPEYDRLQRDTFQEALRDRIISIPIPYILKLKDEIRIYEKNYTSEKVGRHIAPHTIEVAAMFAVCSRLEQPKNPAMNILQKMRLYNGEAVAGYTEQTVRELRKEAQREGHKGIGPRFIQNAFGACLTKNGEEYRQFLSPFMLLNMIRERIPTNSQIRSGEEQKRLLAILDIVETEYKETVKKEVQLAIAGDVKALETMGQKYIENISAYGGKRKVENKLTGRYDEPDAKFMRSIEEKIGISEAAKDDFRREILQTIGAMAASGRKFNPLDNEKLKDALQKKLFDDTKDTLPIKQFVTAIQDDEQRQKFDTIKERLIKNFGYNDQSATEALKFVASILAR
ncbi:MAG: PrkA family serine protein kinase [Pseudomonadota bacterium]|jgi:serine protein kinase